VGFAERDKFLDTYRACPYETFHDLQTAQPNTILQPAIRDSPSSESPQRASNATRNHRMVVSAPSRAI
jgi:hypothetical protein